MKGISKSVLVGAIALCGCGGGGGGEPSDDGLTDTEFRELVAEHAVDLWLGTDYTSGGDGTFGIDGIGTIVQTLRDLGYDVPLTSADGLYNNYYTPSGYQWTFYYSQSNGVSAYDLKAGTFTDLQKGDLIFLDYDFDFVWDHVAIYVGTYGSYTHAVLTASDYYDEVVITDLDSYSDPFNSDMQWSNVDSKQFDHASIEMTY